MKTYVQLTLVFLLNSTVSLAQQDNFIQSHKINKSYIKAGVRHKSKREDKNYHYIKIRGNKAFKKALKEGKLNSNSNNTYIDIKNVYVSKRDLKGKEELKIGSTITNKRKSRQVINIENSKFKINTNIGMNVISNREDISVVTNIKNSQLGER